MKFDSVTITDIAKALNLSKSTVSRAFKEAADINPETKSRILEYAAKYGYHPSPIASSLKEGRSHSIGVVVSEIANSFFSQVIDGMESVAYNRGYRVIITQSHENYEREKINVKQLCSHSIDGLLISLSSATSDIAHLKEWHGKGLPIVLFDKTSDEIDTYKVKTNNELGAFQATEHLIRRGFKRIAHITALPFLSNTSERLNGYKAALEKYGLPYREDLVRYCRHEEGIIEEVKEALDSLFARAAPPDALLAASERTTISCFQLLSQYPSPQKDIGFAGFSNSHLFHYFSSDIAIVHQPAFEIGKTATELLIRMIEQKNAADSFETKVLEPRLIIGRRERL